MSTHSLEQEVKAFLTAKGVAFGDESASYKQLDFTILHHGAAYFHLEVKEKRQRYNMGNWPTDLAEVDLFILDDLTVRKCLAFSPRSGVLVRDNLGGRYVFFSVVDLALMPRQRINRPIQRNAAALKGKWLINLTHGAVSDSIEASFAAIRRYVDASETILFSGPPCYGNYAGEDIVNAGMTRQPNHWETDFRETR